MEEYSDSDLLSRIYIAAPCPVSWEEMEGDERIRHCQQCQLNVYNIQELSETEVVGLIRSSEGRVCGRLFRRLDGTVVTNNCPKAVRRLYRIAASVLIASLICIGLADGVQAQGLAGAPADPRYGSSGMLSVYESPLPGQLTEHPLIYSYVLSGLIFLWGFTIKNRAKLVLTSLLIGISMFVAGIIAT